LPKDAEMEESSSKDVEMKVETRDNEPKAEERREETSLKTEEIEESLPKEAEMGESSSKDVEMKAEAETEGQEKTEPERSPLEEAHAPAGQPSPVAQTTETMPSMESAEQEKVAAVASSASAARPSWEQHLGARDEQWVVAFNAAAFERFIKAHPKVLGPMDARLKQFVEEHILKVNVQDVTVRMLLEACHNKFGPCSPTVKNRIKQCAAEIVQKVSKYPAAKKNKEAKQPVKVTSTLTSNLDAKWAAEVLAPLGLLQGKEQLAATSPASVVLPILEALRTLNPTKDLLKETELGIIVNLYRQSQTPEVAAAAKELIASWKETVAKAHKKRKSDQADDGSKKVEKASKKRK